MFVHLNFCFVTSAEWNIQIVEFVEFSVDLKS